MTVSTLPKHYGDTRLIGDVYWSTYWREYYVMLDVNIGGTPGLVEVFNVRFSNEKGLVWDRVQHMTAQRDDELVGRLDEISPFVAYGDDLALRVAELVGRASKRGPLKQEWANL